MTIETARPQNKNLQGGIYHEKYLYISVGVVMLVMMVASAFLLTAADAPVREAGGYVTLIFGAIATWATAKALLAERDNEERRASDHAHNHA